VSAPDTFKDHFSPLAAAYSEFRPTYPPALLDYVAGLCSQRHAAWDCACGSGQATIALAERFARVFATDASARQLASAPRHARVSYTLGKAEDSGLERESVDLVAVAQAAHWFDLPRFYGEVQRVLRTGGVLALWSYGPLHVDSAEVDRPLQTFYREIVGPFWPPERQLVDDGYRGLPFPYAELDAPNQRMQQHWPLPRLMGYVRSWSATGRYMEQRGTDPVADLEAQLAPLWGDPQRARAVEWPLAVRVGRKP
jgi:SAM-dependent methyltransferase